MKLYSVTESPPSLGCRLVFKHLNIPYDLVDIDFNTGEMYTDWYTKLNPQREMPLLDDDGFLISESVAIMQYICDKYAPDSSAYPKDPQVRALINHRLCFNMASFYIAIATHTLVPIYYEIPRNDASLTKAHNALELFEEYLRRVGKKYVVADHVTIADFAFIPSFVCLEGIGFSFEKFTLAKSWYDHFKKENPEVWLEAEKALKVIQHIEKNPPDLSKLNHPVFPVRKQK